MENRPAALDSESSCDGRPRARQNTHDIMIRILKALWLVASHMFRKRVTILYPEERPYLAPRWRGRIILSRDPDGEERCVACYLCAVACPVDCISLQATENSSGRRYPEFFRINF